MLERHIEDALCKYPELIEPGLTFKARQVVVDGKRIDVLFMDSHGFRLIVEVKRGVVVRENVAQLLDYEGYFVTPNNPETRVMLVGNRVPPNLRKALDHHGFEWRELTERYLESFLVAKGDEDLARVFRPEPLPAMNVPPPACGERGQGRTANTKGLPSLNVASFEELKDVLQIRAAQCPTNYMDLLLLENVKQPLSTLVRTFHAVPRHAGSGDFGSVGRVKAHIKFRRNHDRWEFQETGPAQDPVVKLIGIIR